MENSFESIRNRNRLKYVHGSASASDSDNLNGSGNKSFHKSKRASRTSRRHQRDAEAALRNGALLSDISANTVLSASTTPIIVVSPSSSNSLLALTTTASTATTTSLASHSGAAISRSQSKSSAAPTVLLGSRVANGANQIEYGVARGAASNSGPSSSTRSKSHVHDLSHVAHSGAGVIVRNNAIHQYEIKRNLAEDNSILSASSASGVSVPPKGVD